MYKGVQCIMKISPLLIPSAEHSEVFEMEGEFQVKGRKTYTSTPFCCSFSCISLSSIFKLLDSPPPINYCLLIMFISSQCAFGVAVPDWPKSEDDVSVGGEENWPVGGADGPRGWSQDGMAERWALQKVMVRVGRRSCCTESQRV